MFALIYFLLSMSMLLLFFSFYYFIFTKLNKEEKNTTKTKWLIKIGVDYCKHYINRVKKKNMHTQHTHTYTCLCMT